MGDISSVEGQEGVTPQQSNAKGRSKRWVWGIVGLVVVLSAVTAWWLLRDDQATEIATPPEVQSPVVVEAGDTTPLGRFIAPKTGESWLATPKQLPNLGLSPEADAGSGQESYYWEVGARDGVTIIFRDEPVPGESVRVFEKTTDGAYSLIAQPISTAPLDDEGRHWAQSDLHASVKIDWDTRYDSLSMPTELDLAGGEKVTRTWGRLGRVATTSEGTHVTDVAKYGKSTLQRLEVPNADTGLTNIGYQMLFPTGRVVTLEYIPFTELLENYRWNDGKKATVTSDDGNTEPDSLKAIARGCGYLQGVTSYPGLKKDQVEAIGTTDRGEVVYHLKNKDAKLYQLSYEEYLDYKKADNREHESVDKESFIASHAVVLIESPNNGMLVYVRNSYAPQYGCGKPVIYLYPTMTTTLSVGVGADVTISDPYYPVGGWRDVTAEPSGQLTYQGGHYRSLYWEGTGFGQYPAVTAGLVVPRAKAAIVIEAQLRRQGLNQQEIVDFMEYWADKIPNRPYVRLTWLTQQQIDVLAPLYLSEQPDTVIRVFLDMAGLDAPILLPPQSFSTPPERRGFTVIEWGGLVTM